MKQLLLISLIAFSLFACSAEDSDATSNRQLKKITSYSLVDGKQEFKGEYFFENGREVSGRYIRDTGEMLETRNQFNEGGLLARTDEKVGAEGVFKIDREYAYDNKNRLTKIISYFEDSKSTRNFVYNSDNTITGDTFLGSKATYYLNELGLINKEVIESSNSTITITAAYENNRKKNLNKFSTNDSIEDSEISIEYQELDFPQKNIVANSYGSNNNFILDFGLFTPPLLQRFDINPSKIILNGNPVNIVYRLDSDGYIIRRERFDANGQVGSIEIYEYN